MPLIPTMTQIMLLPPLVYLVSIVTLSMTLTHITLVGYALVLLVDLLAHSYLDALINLAQNILSHRMLPQIPHIHTSLLHCNMDGMLIYLYLTPPLLDCLIRPHVIILNALSLIPLIRMALYNVNCKICLMLHYLHYIPPIPIALYPPLYTVLLISGSLLPSPPITTFAPMVIHTL